MEELSPLMVPGEILGQAASSPFRIGSCSPEKLQVPGWPHLGLAHGTELSWRMGCVGGGMFPWSHTAGSIHMKSQEIPGGSGSPEGRVRNLIR